MTGSETDRRLMASARRILAAQVALVAKLPPGYIQNPALVILLTLYLHRGEQLMTHRAVCDAIGNVPLSVSTRWINAIERDGLIASNDASIGSGDPMVSLTSRGLSTINIALLALAAAVEQVRDEDV